MVTEIFDAVAKSLQKIGQRLNLTYNVVNIIVYYMIIPLTWLVMLDFIMMIRPLLSVIWIFICMGIVLCKRKTFNQWCDTQFVRSQSFLLWFSCIGWNYVKASVIICVFIPIVIYITLVIFLLNPNILQ